MQTQHITTAYDRELEAIQAQIMRMGGLVEEAIRTSAKALEELDLDLAEKILARDHAIDELDELINQEVARLIALRAPTAVDLRLILTVMKVAGSLERIGDYAKNMAKRTHVLSELPPMPAGTASLRRMAREVERMLNDALDA